MPWHRPSRAPSPEQAENLTAARDVIRLAEADREREIIAALESGVAMWNLTEPAGVSRRTIERMAARHGLVHSGTSPNDPWVRLVDPQ